MIAVGGRVRPLQRRGTSTAVVPVQRWLLGDILNNIAILLVLALLSQPSRASAAEGLPSPAGRVILTISGNIERANEGGIAAFDREMLERIGTRTIRTTTTWTDGVKIFEGPLMRDVLALVGAHGTSVEAKALNDYVVKIPIADFMKYDVLLALRMDGRDLLPTDQGPIWIVYPRDQFRELQNARYDERWCWQLIQLAVQ
jgi:hypothetical protein